MFCLTGSLVLAFHTNTHIAAVASSLLLHQHLLAHGTCLSGCCQTKAECAGAHKHLRLPSLHKHLPPRSTHTVSLNILLHSPTRILFAQHPWLSSLTISGMGIKATRRGRSCGTDAINCTCGCMYSLTRSQSSPYAGHSGVYIRTWRMHACMHATMHDWQVSDEGTLMRLLKASSPSAQIHLFWLPTCTAGSSPLAGRLRLATFWLPSAWSQVGAGQVDCAQHAMLDMNRELDDSAVRLPAMQAWCLFLSHLRPPALLCAPLHMCCYCAFAQSRSASISTASSSEPCTSSRYFLLWSRFALDTVTQENYIHIPAEGEQLKWYQNPVHPFCIAANILW